MEDEQFTLYVSYNQLVVRDSKSERFPEWNDRLFEQGFARLEEVVAFRSIIDWGVATVHVSGHAPTRDSTVQRGIIVPFLSTSGTTWIFAPDAPDLGHRIQLEPGSYRLTCLQRFDHEDHEGVSYSSVWLSFERSGLALPQCQIILADDDLTPSGEIIELADPIP
jgi:hypothetical protein